MHYRLSKHARVIIIINIILALIVGVVHCYNVYRIMDTERIIEERMAEDGIVRESAIRFLEREGVDLFIGFEFETYSGLIVTIATILLMYRFSKSNGFVLGFMAGFSAMFTSFIGGLLMFYTLLSNKSQTTTRSSGAFSSEDEFETFIHSRAEAESN